MTFSIVILAAGQSKRMRSAVPKIAHPLAGKPLLEHVLSTVTQLHPDQPPIVVYGYQGELIQRTFKHLSVTWVHQSEPLGTGHAVQQALPKLTQQDRTLILYGDVPLISQATLEHLLSSTPQHALGIITAQLADPTGLGRIIRDEQERILKIVEEKDATPAERKLHEINTGIYLIPTAYLQASLPLVKNHNAQQEYYLTDIIGLAIQDGMTIHSISPAYPEEILGVNNRVQLAQLERFYQKKCAESIMLEGVTLLDPTRFDLRGELTAGQDVTIDINVILEGRVVLGDRCHIGPNTLLRNVTLGHDVDVKANSIIEGAAIASHCIIGPFARIRPGTQLGMQSHVGNFVEIKNAQIGAYTKMNHLSYIGDSLIGNHVNIGAGTITCNYDGVKKHQTLIGDYAFIGSATQLVAPVRIGENATIGAGSTITRDAPANQLTLCRTEQRTIEKWQRPMKEERES